MASYMDNTITFQVPIAPFRDASGCVYFTWAYTVPIEPLAWRAPNGTVYFTQRAHDHAKYEHAAEVAQRAAAAQHAAEVAQCEAEAAQRAAEAAQRAEVDAKRAAAAAQREVDAQCEAEAAQRAETDAKWAAAQAEAERVATAAAQRAESERAAAAAKRATERSVAKRALHIASKRKAALAIHASARQQQQQQRKTTQMPFVRPARPLHRKPLLYPETRLRGADGPEVLARARAHAEVCRKDLAARRRAAKLLAEQQQQQQQEEVDEQQPTKAASSAVSAQDAEHERVVTARQRRLEAARGLFYPQWRHRLQWAAVGAAQAERQSAQLRDSDGGREPSVDASSERSLLHATDASTAPTSSPTASVAGSDPQQLPFPTDLADVEDFDPARDEQQPQRAPSPFAPVPASSSPASSSSPAASASPGHLTPTEASLMRAVSRSASRATGSACKPGRSLSPDAPAACHSARVLRNRRAAACARETEAAEERARAQRGAKNKKLVARATQRAVERGSPAPGLLSATISSTGKVHL